MAEPRWLEQLLTKQALIEEALHAPLGDMFACGLFGCAFDTPGPWAVKITSDPSEGPVWSLIQGFEEESPEETTGLATVKDVVRLRPDVTIKRKKTPVYAIIREEISPLWEKEKLFTDHTLRQLGLHPGDWERFRDYKALWEDDFHGIDPAVRTRCLDLRKLLEGLLWFKRAADHRAHAATLRRRKAVEEHIEAADGFMARAFDLMKTPLGAPVYMALHGLVTHYDVYLRDVHWMNVGWRVYDRIDGRELPITIIIFDPGLASDMGESHVREVSLAANGEDSDLDPETVRCALACELNETDDVWDAREEAFRNLSKNPRHYG